MDKTTIIGRRIESDGRSYDVGDIKAIGMFRQGITMEFVDGTFKTFQGRPEDFYSIADMCPWADKYPMV